MHPDHTLTAADTPLAAELAVVMLAKLAQRGTPENVVAAALPRCVMALGSPAGGVVQQQGRQWSALHWVGEVQELPEDWIAEAVDRGQIVQDARFAAIPLDTEGAVPHVLLLQSPTAATDRETRGTGTAGEKRLRAIGQVFAAALQAAHASQSGAVRSRRLEEMLRIAVQWSGKEDCDELLEMIAATAARLLDAERASIFLWDRARRVLVGRPALGVEGNSLEVDDAAGVVGAVLHSGQPRRWHYGDDVESEVNRSIDRRLHFETRSLVAVPLWDVSTSGGRRTPIGVFEVINRHHGAFTADDVSGLEELATQAAAAIQNTQGRQRLIENRNRLVDSAAETARVIGGHPSIAAVRDTSARVADTELSVLILGENGTGKEVLARSIHFQSRRKHQPFVAVNCAALVETLLESELFGHEKGAFTDAHQTRQGKFELATGGTLFLDEIGDLSQGGQAKLLRVLEEKKVIRVGGSQPIPVDVRVIAATNQPLVEMVRGKRFREDLYFRLNVVTLNLPPLRDRDADIITLAEHFLEQFAHQVGRRVPRLSASAQHALRNYSWPGNIRELRNSIERITYLCPQEVIEEADLGMSHQASGLREQPPIVEDGKAEGRTLSDATRDFQVFHIERAIEACGGNMTNAAQRLGLHRSNLYRKMRQLGMETSES